MPAVRVTYHPQAFPGYAPFAFELDLPWFAIRAEPSAEPSAEPTDEPTDEPSDDPEEAVYASCREVTFAILNHQHDPAAADHAAIARRYADTGHYAMSVGDELEIDGPAGRRRCRCDHTGWTDLGAGAPRDEAAAFDEGPPGTTGQLPPEASGPALDPLDAELAEEARLQQLADEGRVLRFFAPGLVEWPSGPPLSSDELVDLLIAAAAKAHGLSPDDPGSWVGPDIPTAAEPPEDAPPPSPLGGLPGPTGLIQWHVHALAAEGGGTAGSFAHLVPLPRDVAELELANTREGRWWSVSPAEGWPPYTHHIAVQSSIHPDRAWHFLAQLEEARRPRRPPGEEVTR